MVTGARPKEGFRVLSICDASKLLHPQMCVSIEATYSCECSQYSVASRINLTRLSPAIYFILKYKTDENTQNKVIVEMFIKESMLKLKTEH